MRRCAFNYFRRTCCFLSTITQGPIDSSDSSEIKGFYSSFSYDDELKQVEVPHLSMELLPFQKEGVGWMAQRELTHIGGIMADHLGMGKTVQMIGLCLMTDSMNKLMKSNNFAHKNPAVEGNRLLTVLRQMQRLSFISNCSRINRPAEDLLHLISQVNTAMDRQGSGFKHVRSELEKWLQFASKFYPSYEKRAISFLNDEQKRDFELIESKELRTLVVVPASLLLQWKSEIESKIKKSRGISVYLYHGGNKWVSSTELETYDFVITTYETLTYSAVDAFIPGDKANSFAFLRKGAGPLFHIHWKRIILDEAHMVRHAKTQRWRAVQELRGLHRWAVTATPLHNSLEDLQNLLFFVGVPKLPLLPGSNSEDLLNDPALQHSIARSLQPALLRRGPIMYRNGQREVLVQLPTKTEVVTTESFSLPESQLYNGVLAKSRSALASSERKEGTFHIFAMMTRLRQACCHPWISEGRSLKVSVCGICQCEAVGTVTTKCGHAFCNECLLLRFREAVDGDELATKIPCPTCAEAVSYDSVFKKQILSSAARIAQFKEREFELSTKLKMILKAISDMKKNHPKDKMIIFSHFTSFMDVISVALDRYQIEHLRLDGTMPLTLRNSTIQHFQSSTSVQVILASKTSTGVGLNLTAANHVLVVDPWWNPAIEEQAVHRCYRIGQRKPVYVTRFIIADTIEQYCFDICQKKKEFGDAILKAATSNNSSAKLAATRLQQLMARLSYVESTKKHSKASSPPTGSDDGSHGPTQPKAGKKKKEKRATGRASPSV
ncbi:DNA repair protein [Strigomonas culicis]|uniref:DNA repair protein n=1 Tax=Strigomonas culicis TaxID=28005 RepID=S9TSA0_9TRYP|nr:DNA repair protein [Strigomonas culicis]|eukprot:EPY21262.1 DNA repair protein [Strigomonas culicis]